MDYKHLILILSYASFVVSNISPEKSPLLRVVQHESDQECLKEKNINGETVANQFAACMQDTIAGLMTALHPDSNPIQVAVDHICKNPALVDCLKQMETTLGSCLSDEKKKRLNVHMKPVFALIETTCENDATEIKGLVEKGKDCISDKKFEVMMCLQSALSSSTILEANTFEQLQTEEGCKNAAGLAKCTVEATSTCADDSLSKFLDHIFTNMIKSSYCADLL